MIKFLCLTAVALLSAATMAHAGPLIGAIGAVAGWIGTLGVIGQSIISIGLSVGVGLIQKAFAGKSDGQETSDPGVSLSIKMGDNQPVTFIAGNYATAGRRKYAGVWGNAGGTPNAYFVDVIELSNLPQSGLNGVWVDDQKVTLLTGEAHSEFGFPVSEYRSGGADYLWVKFYDGNQTTADAYLVDRFGSNTERPYGANRIGRGCAYAVVTCRYNSDLFSGSPNMLFEVGSIKLYDLRKDSSVGGSGSHRWNDPATWEPSDNLAVIIYNIERGIYSGDQWIYGGQNLSAYRQPVSNWMAAMNACDALIDDGDGNMVPSFRGGYEFRGDERPLDAIEKLRKACNAHLAEVGGIFKIQIGAPGSAVYAFSDNDVLISKGQSFAPHGSLDDTTNAIEATYPEPAEKWAMKDAPARYNDVLEIEDNNNRLPYAETFEACPYGGQVQRLMLAMINDARRFRTHQIWLPPEAWTLEPNDVVSWTSARNGYANKKFQVVSVSAPMSANVAVSLKEIDPSDYDWSASDALGTSVGWIGKIGVPAQIMSGWTVEPATIFDNNGNGWKPTIKVSWAGGLDDVEWVWVQVRYAADGRIVFDSSSTRYASPYSSLLPPIFLRNTEYEVQGKYIPKTSRETQWSAWLSVTTPDVYEDLELTLDRAGKELRDRFEGLYSDFQLTSRNIAELASTVSLQGAVGQLQREEMREETGNTLALFKEETLVRATEDEALSQRITTFSTQVDQNSALIQQETTARTTADDALASQITTIGAQVGQNSASIVTEQTARTDADTALSEQTNSIAAYVNDSFAGGQIKFSASADQSGVDARFSILLRAGTGAVYKESGFFLEIYTEGGTQKSRFAVNADQFVVLGSGGQSPFLFEGGVLKLNASHIGLVRAGELRSFDDKFIVDLNNRYFSVSD